MRTGSRIVFVLALTVAVFAQDGDSASNSCPVAPFSLFSMRNCYRPLLLFAHSMKDPEFVQQIEKLRTHTSEIRERDIVVVPVISHEAIRSHLPPDLPSAELSQSEVAAVTSRFKVSSDSFRVILVGKDGNQKLSRKAPVSFGELSTLIDSMPMRKQEIMRRSQDRKLQ